MKIINDLKTIGKWKYKNINFIFHIISQTISEVFAVPIPRKYWVGFSGKGKHEYGYCVSWEENKKISMLKCISALKDMIKDVVDEDESEVKL